MDPAALFLPAAAVILGIALAGFMLSADVLKKVLALNVMASGVFLLFATLARRGAEAPPDPVPHALALTGIVVSFATSALALGLARRVHARTGATRLPEDEA